MSRFHRWLPAVDAPIQGLIALHFSLFDCSFLVVHCQDGTLILSFTL
jgi:hypothetical protein